MVPQILCAATPVSLIPPRLALTCVTPAGRVGGGGSAGHRPLRCACVTLRQNQLTCFRCRCPALCAPFAQPIRVPQDTAAGVARVRQAQGVHDQRGHVQNHPHAVCRVRLPTHSARVLPRPGLPASPTGPIQALGVVRGGCCETGLRALPSHRPRAPCPTYHRRYTDAKRDTCTDACLSLGTFCDQVSCRPTPMHSIPSRFCPSAPPKKVAHVYRNVLPGAGHATTV